LIVVVVSVLSQHVELLKLVPGNQLVSLVLDVLGGGEGGVSSFQLLHGDLLSLGSHQVHLGELVGGLGFENGDTGGGGQRVLSVLLRLDGLLDLVLLVNLHVNFVLDNIDPGVDHWRVLSVLPRLVSLQCYLGKLFGDLDIGVGGQRLLGVLLRLGGLLTLVVLCNLLVNFVLDSSLLFLGF
jgi:hypothetical protein